MKKKLLIGVSIVVGVLLITVVGLGLLLDANQFRPRLEAMMSESLGRPVTIANIKLSLLSGGVAIDGLTIADDPAFSRVPFVTATSVSVGVNLLPLIMSRSLQVESFRLDQPHVVLLRSATGVWNFSSLGSRSNSGAATMAFLVQKLRIAGGQIVIGGRNEATRTYDDVNVDVSDLSYTSQFPFHVTAKMPGGGTLTLGGHAGPFNTKDAAETPFDATVELKQLDVASSGFVDPASGVRGMLDFTGSLTSDGVRMNTKGRLSATKAQLLPGAAPSGAPVVVDYATSYNAKAESGTLTQGDVHVGTAVARLTGDYNTGGKTPTVRMRLVGEKMPVTELEAALPAIGVRLPKGSSLKQGALDMDLAIAGPADRLVITGPLNLSNGTLAGFDLGAKLGALASFAGLPKMGDTVIETLSTTLRVAPDGIQADAMNMVAPAIGTLTGAGTIAPQGAMDFKMLAKLKDGVLGGISGNVGRVVSFAQSSGIPFRVQGTTSNPVFVPDVGAAAKTVVTDAVKNPDNIKKAVDAIGGLFGGKK